MSRALGMIGMAVICAAGLFVVGAYLIPPLVLLGFSALLSLATGV